MMHRPPAVYARRQGFTLIELLVVIAIIAILLGLLFPALSSVRQSARKAATRTLINTVGNAMTAFQTDQRRAPGFFTPQQIGSADNFGTGSSTPGITFMENALLDLIGGVEGAGGSNPGYGNSAFSSQILCNGDYAWIVPSLMGDKDGPGYLSLPGDVLRPIKGQKHNGFLAQTAEQEDLLAESEPIYLMPDIIDPWGAPLLLWPVDPTANPASDPFAAVTSQCGGNRAQVYWAGNGSILDSNRLALGPKAVNLRNESLLGAANTAALRERTLWGVAGHPDFPNPNPGPGQSWSCPAGGSGDGDPPARPLAENVIHSAGPDRIFAEAKKGIEAVGYGDGVCANEVRLDEINDVVVGVGG